MCNQNRIITGNTEELSTNPYASTDPAPPASEENPEVLKNTLLDENLSLFKRYRAMFALRNKGMDKYFPLFWNG